MNQYIYWQQRKHRKQNCRRRGAGSPPLAPLAWPAATSMRFFLEDPNVWPLVSVSGEKEKLHVSGGRG